MGEGALDTDALGRADAEARALRGGAVRAGGRALGLTLSLVSAPILIHYLGVGGFGQYTTVTALVALVGTGTEAGLLAIAMREFAVREGGARTVVMRHLLGIRVVVTAVGVLVAAGFGLLAGYDDVRVIGILTAGTGLVLVMTQGLLAVPLQASLQFVRVTLLELMRQALTVVVIVAMVVAGAGLGAFFTVPIIAGAIALAVTIPMVRSSVSVWPAINPRAWAPLVRETLPFAVATAIYAAYFRVAIIVMSLRASEIETGYFATSYRVIEVLIALPAIAVTAAFPVLARAERDDQARFTRAATRMAELAVIAGFAAALGLLLGAPLIIDALAPKEGEPAVEVLRIQAPTMIATFVAIACTFPLLTLRRPRAILTANLVAFAAVIALTVALVGPYEARGAAAAATIAEFLLAGVIVALLRRQIPEILSMVRVLPAVVPAAALGAAVLLVPGLPAGLDTAIGLTAFAGVLALLGRFPPEVARLLPRGR
jgi:O-antigen/teichoic acid export membrane protein